MASGLVDESDIPKMPVAGYRNPSPTPPPNSPHFSANSSAEPRRYLYHVQGSLI